MNTILTIDVIAKEALRILREMAVMPRLVYRDYSKEFIAGRGDTISIRKPVNFDAKEFTDQIEIQDITEEKITITLDKQRDISFNVTDKDLTLNITDFSERFLKPAMMAFLKKVDQDIIALEKFATSRISHASGDISPRDIVSLNKALNDSLAPMEDRNIVLGTQAQADLLNNELFVSAERVGNSDAMKNASLGRKFGFDIYTDQNVVKTDTYTPTIAFHKNAIALVTRPLALPLGAKEAKIVDFDGFSLRVVYGYNQQTKTDTISIDMLYGVKLIDNRLISVLADTRS